MDLRDKKILLLQQQIDEIEFDKTYYTETLPARIKELEASLDTSRVEFEVKIDEFTQELFDKNREIETLSKKSKAV